MARVLVIDDEPNITKLLSIVLTERGYDVVTASNGILGLELLEQGPIPDLIITDLNMPSMNGKVMIKRIKENQNTASIPILILTGYFSELPSEEYYQAMEIKPFDLNRVVKIVNHLTKPNYQDEKAYNDVLIFEFAQDQHRIKANFY